MNLNFLKPRNGRKEEHMAQESERDELLYPIVDHAGHHPHVNEWPHEFMSQMTVVSPGTDPLTGFPTPR